MPVTSRGVSRRERSGSMRPSKLSSRPRHSMPALDDVLTTARMTAFSPGASPPPVRTPIRVTAAMPAECIRSRGTIPVSSTRRGRLAQLGERRVRNAEVGSSSLLPSTTSIARSAQEPLSEPSRSEGVDRRFGGLQRDDLRAFAAARPPVVARVALRQEDRDLLSWLNDVAEHRPPPLGVPPVVVKVEDAVADALRAVVAAASLDEPRCPPAAAHVDRTP